jgi:mono/diheme cytochrome c family protein
MAARMSRIFALVAVFLLAVPLPPRPGAAQEPETELGPVFLLSLGGKLYDDFWTVLDQFPPSERNPAVPDNADTMARETWRCATCHGWDYAGAEVGGVSFPGVIDLAGTDAEAIKERILDPAHPFPASEIPDLALDLLAFFIRDGLYVRADFLDENGLAKGNLEFGRDIYEGACMNCHQLDGRRFLRGERGDRSSLGWVVRNRPEQALHKIINGVPAAEMLSLRFLTIEAIADLVAYLQVLDPAEQ